MGLTIIQSIRVPLKQLARYMTLEIYIEYVVHIPVS